MRHTEQRRWLRWLKPRAVGMWDPRMLVELQAIADLAQSRGGAAQAGRARSW